MTQRLDNQYRDYKKLRVVEATELLRSFIYESDEEDTGLQDYEMDYLSAYLETLGNTLLYGREEK